MTDQYLIPGGHVHDVTEDEGQMLDPGDGVIDGGDSAAPAASSRPGFFVIT